MGGPPLLRDHRPRVEDADGVDELLLTASVFLTGRRPDAVRPRLSQDADSFDRLTRDSAGSLAPGRTEFLVVLADPPRRVLAILHDRRLWTEVNQQMSRRLTRRPSS